MDFLRYMFNLILQSANLFQNTNNKFHRQPRFENYDNCKLMVYSLHGIVVYFDLMERAAVIMNTNCYKILEVVVETKNFTRAAEKLYLTPSAVSHAVARIEEEFGFPVFIRTREGVSLTNDGKAILPYVHAIIRDSESLAQKAAGIAGINEGSITIGAYYAVMSTWMVDILREFHERYPDIHINVYQGGYKDVLRWIENGDVDLSFVADTIADNFDYVPLYRDDIVCVAPPDYIPKEKNYITSNDLISMPLIQHEEIEDGEDIRVLKKVKVHNGNYAFKIEDDNCIMAVVEAGLGVAFFGELATRKRLANVSVYPFKPNISREIGLYVANPESISPAAERMKNIIIDYVSKLQNSVI